MRGLHPRTLGHAWLTSEVDPKQPSAFADGGRAELPRS